MNRNNKLRQQIFFPILLISLFLQSCSSAINLSDQGERLETEQMEGRLKITTMELEEASELGNFDMFPIELVQ